MEIKLTIPTEKATEFRDYLCDKFGYEVEIPDPNDDTKKIPNTESKAQFAKRQIIEMLKRDFSSWKYQERMRVSYKSALDTDIKIT